jgi:ABC-type lipoprotein release transport system permease subunit
LVIAVVSSAVFAVALLASLIPARHAGTTDPLTAIRAE